MKSLYFFGLLLSISFIADVNADFRFWKKKTTTSTTETPLISNPILGLTPGSTTTAPINKGATTKVPVNTQQALAGAANPGLVIGAGTTGENIKNNGRPQRPNPGTEVGLDLPKQKPATGYRDWAIDLTGAGEGGQPPKVPSQGPALSPGQQTRPGSPALGTSTGQQPVSGPQTSKPSTPGHQTPSPKPASLGYPSQPAKPGIPTSSGTPTQTPKPATPGHQTPSPKPASLGYPSQPSRPGTPVQAPQPGTAGPQTPSRNPGPGSLEYPSLPSRPGTPTSPGNQPNFQNLPTPGKTFAQAASDNNKPGSSTPAPKQGVLSSGGTQPGKSGLPAAAAVGAKEFSSDPKFSPGNTVTNEDLEKLSEALFIKDTNNAMKFITLNLQKKTTSTSPVDEAPEPLFNVRPEAFQIPTIAKVRSIYDNYHLDTGIVEKISPSQRQEESSLVDTFLSTNVMSFAMRFLSDKGLVKREYYSYKDLLRRLWFNLYSRGDGKISSSGFEHVFMSELKSGTEVGGLHNWIYFNDIEPNSNTDYLGYIKKVDLGDKAAILDVHGKFNGVIKPVTTIFVGTSPELEMSLYTVCFLVRPNESCPVSLGGTKFNIMTHKTKSKYQGIDVVSTAYPII